MLVDHALSRMSSDNLSCMIVRLDPTGKFEGVPSPIGTPESEGERVDAATDGASKKTDRATPPPKEMSERVAKG